ncbi:MAG: hypothetical protein SNF33_02355 [Candidatus Algichlamydia australiensis]|nr:hypothetical protein [Chlamydiales bacterium]
MEKFKNLDVSSTRKRWLHGTAALCFFPFLFNIAFGIVFWKSLIIHEYGTFLIQNLVLNGIGFLIAYFFIYKKRVDFLLTIQQYGVPFGVFRTIIDYFVMFQDIDSIAPLMLTFIFCYFALMVWWVFLTRKMRKVNKIQMQFS